MTIRVLHWIPGEMREMLGDEISFMEPEYPCLSGNIWIRTNMRQTAELIFETMRQCDSSAVCGKTEESYEIS